MNGTLLKRAVQLTGELPTTSLVICSGIGLSWATYFAWAVLDKAIPAGWLVFLSSVLGISSAHFVAKRMTQFKGTNASVPPVPPAVQTKSKLLKG